LFIFCWPLAILALIAYPFVWLLLLPFRIVGIAVEGLSPVDQENAAAGTVEIADLVLYYGAQPTFDASDSVVILQFKCRLADVVLRHCRSRTLWKFLQELPKRIAHSLWILLLPENERLVLERHLAFVSALILCQNGVPIAKRAIVIFIVFVSFGAMRVSRARQRIFRESLHKKSECLDNSGNVFHLQITGTELIRRLGPQFRRKL